MIANYYGKGTWKSNYTSNGSIMYLPTELNLIFTTVSVQNQRSGAKPKTSKISETRLTTNQRTAPAKNTPPHLTTMESPKPIPETNPTPNPI